MTHSHNTLLTLHQTVKITSTFIYNAQHITSVHIIYDHGNISFLDRAKCFTMFGLYYNKVMFGLYYNKVICNIRFDIINYRFF